jgi:flagellar motility protein MotE (MotC chaperone)
VKLPDLKQVRQIRLLPVVIFASVALLLLKGTGIMTGGGYVLTGPLTVQAAGGGGKAAPGTDASMPMPAEPTISDDSPVLDDGAPTLPLRAETAAEGHGAEAEAGHGEAPATADAAHGTPSPAKEPCPPGLDFLAERDDCVADPGAAQTADAVPMITDGTGNPVPLATAEGNSETQLLGRLADRRDELDEREDELDMRMALVEAAEQRIAERTAALEALEARINAMVDEKRTLEEAQFVAVVSTYETMKPKDAAGIFDELEMEVLVRIGRALNPRKLAPIMARMNPIKAKDLTANLAVDQVEPTIAMTPVAAVGQLPQIVGQ